MKRSVTSLLESYLGCLELSWHLSSAFQGWITSFQQGGAKRAACRKCSQLYFFFSCSGLGAWYVLNCATVKKYTEVWIPSTLECDLIWRQDLVDVIRMRSHWCRVGSPSEMAGILLRRWCNVKTQEGLVIDWSYAAARQGMPKMARKPGEVREGQGWIPLQISKGTWSCWHVDFGHLASRTMRQ